VAELPIIPPSLKNRPNLGPAQLAFWAFWIGHTIITASAVYDTAVLGFQAAGRTASFKTNS
jgi:hypothetical protein